MNNYSYLDLVNTLREAVIKEASSSSYIDPWFLHDHLLKVEEFANWLCDLYPQANRNIVCLGIWLHDIGRLRGVDEEHHVYGAKEAEKLLP